ncbi:DNA-binding domain-containing protein [Paucibacter sp. AS339]|uniref:DNA-binding domain-containing protein n=1 Tax=Paucibacter hankyongi TaxID=3133434 RepID=UPI00309CFE5C
MKPEASFHAAFLSDIDACRRAAPEGEVCSPQSERPAAFAIYVNTGLKAAIDALAANYPSLLHGLGEACFYPLARHYALEHPPRDGRLFLYGEDMADFLQGQPSGSLDPSMIELARLDRLWTLAHVAADAPPLDVRRWAGQEAAALAQSTLSLAPATAWYSHPDLPLAQQWPAAREPHGARLSGLMPAAGLADADGSNLQALLITRPGDSVRVQPISRAACVFLDGCAQGLSVIDAMQQVLDRYPDSELQALLATLLAQGAFAESTEATAPNFL